MDRKRPFWKSSVLHLALIAGALVFALPYAWLLGTSWKLEKEVQSAEVRIFPQRPMPLPNSPYIDARQFEPIAKPEQADGERWSTWMEALVRERIASAIAEWDDPRASTVDEETLHAELAQGAYQRLLNLIPYNAWQHANEADFKDYLDKALRRGLIGEAFEQAYRYFAIGQVKAKTKDYKLFNLTGDTPVEAMWHIESGPVTMEPRVEAERPVAVLHYDFTDDANAFELSAEFDELEFRPMDAVSGMKRLEVAFRADQTWHEMRAFLEVDGVLYRSAEPQYLGLDRWWEVQFQFPDPREDESLSPKRYVLLEPIGQGPQYDHGPNALKLRIRVERSGKTEALWAKATNNYRRAFDEVPFWRYFKTSLFIVAANIIGTLLSCSLAAYAFARLQWPGRDLCFFLVLATLMIPPQITMIPSFVIYKQLGWYNTLLPLWAPNCLAVNAFAIFLLRQAMKGVPRDIEEAAKIDGCGYMRIYWSVIMPLMKPTMAAIAIFTFMFVWNDFMTPLIYVNDQRLYPLALGLFSFMAGRENQFELIMAGSVIMTLPVIIIFFLAQRHFIQGVTMTGMKN